MDTLLTQGSNLPIKGDKSAATTDEGQVLFEVTQLKQQHELLHQLMARVLAEQERTAAKVNALADEQTSTKWLMKQVYRAKHGKPVEIVYEMLLEKRSMDVHDVEDALGGCSRPWAISVMRRTAKAHPDVRVHEGNKFFQRPTRLRIVLPDEEHTNEIIRKVVEKEGNVSLGVIRSQFQLDTLRARQVAENFCSEYPTYEIDESVLFSKNVGADDGVCIVKRVTDPPGNSC